MEMSFAQEIVLYLIALVTFLVIDLTWLGIVAKERYRKALKKFMVKKFDAKRAFSFYLIYVLGILVMAVIPAINADSLGIALFRGAAFGFFTYATYGLTNWAVVEKWPTRVTFEDIAWGTFLGTAVSVISYNVYVGIYF